MLKILSFLKKKLSGWRAGFFRQLHPPLSRREIAYRYLKGQGIEIGALAKPLPVPRRVQVKYLDRFPVAYLRQQYPELAKQKIIAPDILDDGETFSSVKDQSQDFIIANHFIEHCQDPLRALLNMFRVLKNEGILYLSIPDKRFTFDKDRPATSLEHIKKDYFAGPAWSRQAAFEEYVRKVDKCTDELQAQQRIAHYLKINYAIHFHTFTDLEVLELITVLQKELAVPCLLELILKSDHEIIVILRKSPAGNTRA